MSPVVINLRDMIQEMDGLSDNFKAFLNIRTGEFITLSDEDLGAAEEGDPLDDYPDWHQEVIQEAKDVLFTDDYLALPSQYDIHEYEIMKSFCYTVEDDELRDSLLYRISGRGAFRIFKDTIYEHEITDDWYEYRYQAFREIAKNWLERHNIAYMEEDEDQTRQALPKRVPVIPVGAEMKLTVLMDNNTLIDRYFLAEPGVSYLVEVDGKKILFDVGYSEAFITNARKLAIDLLDVDFVVLSHAHLDHTWGLIPLIRLYTEALIEGLPNKKPALVSHPLTLSSRTYGDLTEAGSLLQEDKLSGYFHLELSREPVYLTERLVFLGEIERTNEFEAKSPMGKILEAGIEKDDFLFDDSALAYKSPDGLVIITGCSHAGICNIVEYAKKVCGDDRVVDIIGGFHLLDPSEEQLQGTIAYMESLRPDSVHACHCTDLNSKIALSKVVNLEEVGVGLTLEY